MWDSTGVLILGPLRCNAFLCGVLPYTGKTGGVFTLTSGTTCTKLESHFFQLCNKRPCAPSSGVGGNSVELNFFFAYHSRTAAGACNKMGSSKLSLNSSSTSIIAHEPAIMGIETCSNDFDQHALCWSTNDHGKPRGTLLPNAVYRHGCRLALVILLFYALFFQAAVAQNTSDRYPGLGWTLINNSASTNSSTYYYYRLQEGMKFSPRSLCIFG